MVLFKVVFEPDAVWEAECYSDDPRDYGLIAFQEGKTFRALGWEVGNTKLKLEAVRHPGGVV